MNQSFLKTAVFTVALAALASSCNLLGDGICTRPSGEVVSETVMVDEFTAIDARDVANVILAQGEAFEVVVEGEQEVLDKMDVRVQNGELVVRLEGCFNGNPTFDVFVTVPSSSPLTAVSVSGASDLVTQNAIEIDDDFELRSSGASDITFDAANVTTMAAMKVSGAGDADVTLSAESMEITISGAGNAKVGGEVKSLDAKISGSGDLMAFPLDTETAFVDVSGSGDAEISITGDDLEVEISGAGSVSYRGTPSNINSRISGAGELINAN